MSRKESRPNLQILEEACTWFATFRSQDLAEDARQEFHQWLKRSPEHIRAYLEIASLYADIPAPEHGRTPPEMIERAKASPDINVFALHAEGRSHHGPGRVGSEVGTLLGTRWPFGLRMALAASILIFVCAGAWLYTDRNTYRTAIGEQRSISMADGSIIEINARSKVRISFAHDRREVELLEGQAFFHVAKDHRRPFVVHAGATSVRAVGTQFDVYRRSTGTTVTVLEGHVAVVSRPGQAAEPIARREVDAGAEIVLAAGEQLTATSTHAQKAERPNIAAATAWTRHQLVFDGTPLAEVLDEFSRYTTRRLVIDTPELADLQISGQYTSTNPDSLLRFLSLQKGIVVTQVNGETHIRQE